MRYTVKVSDGNTYWYKEGTNILHREGGPAIEYANGHKYWYSDGKMHREDGPAVEYSDNEVWYIYGQLVDCSSQEEFEQKKDQYKSFKYDLSGRSIVISGEEYKLIKVRAHGSVTNKL
jgi:hypothetical protein